MNETIGGSELGHSSNCDISNLEKLSPPPALLSKKLELLIAF